MRMRERTPHITAPAIWRSAIASERRAAGLTLALTAVVLVLIGVWQGVGYWEYSDGVYSLSARQIGDGLVPYRDFAAAHPPLLFYLGAGALQIVDHPATIRVLMALCEAATAMLTFVIVARLTGRRGLAMLAGVASLVTPWALREHAQFLPETVAAPVLLATALAVSSPRYARHAGALGAAAVGLKVAMIVPVLAMLLVASGRKRALRSFAVTLIVGIAAFLVLFGADGWENVVVAQRQTGTAAVQYVAALWAQAGWNLLPLLVPALLAWPARSRIKDRELAVATAALSLGALLLLASLFKDGSYLTIMVVIEPPVLCLAACGIAGMADGVVRQRPAVVAAAVALFLGTVQVVSLLAAPGRPKLFTRPFASVDQQRALSSSEVDRQVEMIRKCPKGVSVSAPPYLIFRANRRIAGSQPDQFIIGEASTLARFRERSRRDPVCRIPTSATAGDRAAGWSRRRAARLPRKLPGDLAIMPVGLTAHPAFASSLFALSDGVGARLAFSETDRRNGTNDPRRGRPGPSPGVARPPPIVVSSS
jgi:hypothetical protein